MMGYNRFSHLRSIVRYLLIVIVLASSLMPQGSAFAASSLAITPITWNVVGLDSNNVNVGPNDFPVGARICNPAGNPNLTDVSSSFVWDSSDSYINLRSGSLSSYSNLSIDAGTCRDVYYEVEIARNSSAYNRTRRYHINASSAALGLGTVSTPTPREIFVERLVSQNRNSVTDVQLDGVSVAAGGTMSLMVGNTYDIKLVGSTATNGYEQIESFINFPNTIFKINSVSTTYSANDTLTPDLLAASKPYADGCNWVNDPASPNYRACTDTGKYGGSITVTYNVTIIGGGGTSQTLNTLIYDFSGSSYHYNSDFSTSSRIVSIIDPTGLTIAKAFSPSSTPAGGTSTLTFTISNPTSTTVTGVNFTDPLPILSGGQMVVASPATYSTSGCGSPAFAPAANATSLSFSNGTLAPNGTCSISVVVSVPSSPTTGTYNNISDHLFAGTTDTGKFATANLTLASTSAGTGLCGLNLARWTVPNGTTANPPDTTGGLPTTQASDVSTATASAFIPADSSILTSSGQGDTTSWSTWGYKDDGQYIDFVIDARNYTGVSMSFYAANPTPANGPTSLTLSYNNGSGFVNILTVNNPATTFTLHTQDFTGLTSTTGNTTFRLTATGANNDNSSGSLNYDNISFTGCGTPQPLTLTKAFSPNPVAVGATSTLTFTINNPNSALLSGITFTDSLPSGLQVAATPAANTTCVGSPTWNPSAGATTLIFGNPTGATLAASSSCTVSVNITATASGPHTNVSGFISSTEAGTNSTSTGSAAASLTALQPPSISKFFNPNPILTNGTSTLTFLVTNPNPNDSLSDVAFSDTFPTSPAAMTVASPLTITNSCGGSLQDNSGGSLGIGDPGIRLVSGTVAAGSTCAVSVNATAPTAGSYANTSGIVSTIISDVTSNGNTASDTLLVNAPSPSISLLKQISTSSSGPWSKFISVAPGADVYYQFTIENTGDVPLNPVSVSDPTVSTASCAWTNPLPVASPTQDAIETCIVGPNTAGSGDVVNTAAAHGTYSGTDYDSTSSSAEYVGATPGFSLLKQISTSASGPWSSSITNVTPGGDLYYKFTIVNTGLVELSSVNVTDIISSVNTLASACTFTDPLSTGNATTCVIGPIPASSTAGTYTNTAIAHGTNGGDYDTSPSSASYTLASPDLTITKTNDTSDIATVGTPFTWTLTVSNAGTTGATFADGQTILSDPLPAGPTYGSASAGSFSGVTNSANINCAISSETLSCAAGGASVTIDAGGNFTVSFSVTPTSAASLLNTATVDPDDRVAESDETNNTGSNTVTVVSIDAVDDTGSTVDGAAGGQSLANALTNDSLNGTSPVLLADVNLTQVSTTNAGVTLNTSDGSVNVAVGTPAGTYSVTYQICDKSNPTVCDTATVSVPVVTIDAKDDTGSTVNGTLGGASVANVLANNGNGTDLLNSAAATTGTVDITAVGVWPAGITLNTSTGEVTVAAGTSTGTYTPQYQICDKANPAICDIATVTVPVVNYSAPAIGKAFSPATIISGDTSTITFTLTNSNSIALTNASFTDTLTNMSISGDQSAGGTCTGAGGNSFTNGDTSLSFSGITIPANGSCSVTVLVTSSILGTNPNNAGGVTTTEVPTAGAVSNTASLTVVLIDAVDDSAGPVNGLTGATNVLNVFDNDTLNGSAVNPADVTLTRQPGGDPELTLNGDGSVDVAAGTPAGTYSFDYQICENANPTNCDTATVTITIESPALDVTKTIVSVNFVNPNVITISYSIEVSNIGDTDLNNLQVTDDLTAAFPSPAAFTVNSVSSAAFTVNSGFNGNSDKNLLQGADTLAAGNYGAITLVVQVTTNSTNPDYTNTATASGTSPGGKTVDASGSVSGPTFIDPALTKAVDPTQAAVGDLVTFTITVTNNGNFAATGVVVTDPLPDNLDYVSATSIDNNTSLPRGTITLTPPRTVQVDIGTLNVTDEIIITIVARVNGLGQPPLQNRATVVADPPLEGVSPDPTQNNAFAVSFTVTGSGTGGGGGNVTRLPDTGFAPNVVTVLPPQSADKSYKGYGDVWLEIPRLGVKMPIVGIPQSDGSWDVTWLADQAGWLQGTAFPSWAGNSVLTGHVTLSDGKSGPFVNLSSLRWGDQVIVHAYGQRFIYEVRENRDVLPQDTSVLAHRDLSWITLLTCKDYDKAAGLYTRRVAVSAVLLKVERDQTITAVSGTR